MTKKFVVPNEWKIKWHKFWSDWHLIKHFYYGSHRHLKRHKKHCHKLNELGLAENEIDQYTEPKVE